MYQPPQSTAAPEEGVFGQGSVGVRATETLLVDWTHAVLQTQVLRSPESSMLPSANTQVQAHDSSWTWVRCVFNQQVIKT